MGESEHAVDILDGPVVAPADPVAASGATGPSPAPTGRVNPAALTVAQAARMLGVGEQTIRDHVVASLPTGPGETINLVHYAAWLNQHLKDRDAD